MCSTPPAAPSQWSALGPAGGQDADGGGGELEDEEWTFILQGGGASFRLDRVAVHGADGDRDCVTVDQGSLQIVISAFSVDS